MAEQDGSRVMSTVEPTRTFPPIMVAPVPGYQPKVWRVTDVDLDELKWLVPALQRRWPNLSQDSALNWFKSSIGDRFSNFVRTKNAVGLATFTATIKDPSPTVTEEFIRAKDGYEPHEIVSIHLTFAQWAKAINAREYVLKTDSSGLGSTKEIDAALRKEFGLPIEQRMCFVLRLKE